MVLSHRIASTVTTAFALLIAAPISVRAEDQRPPQVLRFDPVDNEAIGKQFAFEYDLSNRSALRLGSVVFDSNALSIGITSRGEITPSLRTQDSKKAAEPVVYIRVPEELLAEGTLFASDDQGIVLWSEVFTAKDRREWGITRAQLWPDAPTLSSSTFGRMGSDSFIKRFLGVDREFQVCWSSRTDRADAKTTPGTTICGERHRLSVVDGHPLLEKAPLHLAPYPRDASVKINDLPVRSSDVVPVTPGQVLRFQARLEGGESIEFTSTPAIPGISDAYRNDDNSIRLKGTTPAPVGFSNLARSYESESYFDFSATIARPEPHWGLDIGNEDAYLYVRGDAGGIFRVCLDLDHVPPSELSLQLDARVPLSTYEKNVIVSGKRPTSAELSSDESSITTDAEKPDFNWTLKADRGAGTNRNHLIIRNQKDSRRYIAYYDIDRRYAYELSGRLSGMVGSTNNFLLGEGAFSGWFEDLFNLKNERYSIQRWGMKLYATQSLFSTEPALSRSPVAEATRMSLQAFNADFRYRLTPGTWGRDETWGLLGAFQQINLGSVDARMAGSGFFWARSMPKVFDDLMNHLPFMKYPKWVDLDFTYFPLALSQRTTLVQNWVLSFHGKVLWSDRIFGEAGFGAKEYGFNDNDARMRVRYFSLFGSIGAGVQF